jgi:type II secretory pathway component PulJ
MNLLISIACRMSALLVLSLAAGCSSLSGTVNAAKYDSMTCAELNTAVGAISRDISQTAITRGKVANTNVPNWLLGGARVKTAVANRETARIEKLKQQQDALVATRANRCLGSAG